MFIADFFNGDGKPDNITFMIKRIKVHNMNALKDPMYRFPGNYGVEKFLELFSGNCTCSFFPCTRNDLLFSMCNPLHRDKEQVHMIKPRKKLFHSLLTRWNVKLKLKVLSAQCGTFHYDDLLARHSFDPVIFSLFAWSSLQIIPWSLCWKCKSLLAYFRLPCVCLLLREKKGKHYYPGRVRMLNKSVMR